VRLDALTGQIVHRVKVGATPNDGDVYHGSVWFPDKDGSLYRRDEQSDAVHGPYPLHAANPFVVSGYAGRLWIADYGGTDTLVVDPARLPST
jgi:streptogramin lyase